LIAIDFIITAKNQFSIAH